MFGLGLPELLIILLILLLLFGSTKLPKLARSLGQSAGELQKGIDSAKKTNEEKQKSPGDKEEK